MPKCAYSRGLTFRYVTHSSILRMWADGRLVPQECFARSSAAPQAHGVTMAARGAWRAVFSDGFKEWTPGERRARCAHIAERAEGPLLALAPRDPCDWRRPAGGRINADLNLFDSISSSSCSLFFPSFSFIICVATKASNLRRINPQENKYNTSNYSRTTMLICVLRRA